MESISNLCRGHSKWRTSLSAVPRPNPGGGRMSPGRIASSVRVAVEVLCILLHIFHKIHVVHVVHVHQHALAILSIICQCQYYSHEIEKTKYIKCVYIYMCVLLKNSKTLSRHLQISLTSCASVSLLVPCPRQPLRSADVKKMSTANLICCVS